MEDYNAWVNKRYVLSTKGFPSCTSLRFPKGRETGKSLNYCSCGHYERHRDVLHFLEECMTPWMKESFLGREPEFPKIEVCFNTFNLWVDNIPCSISGAEKNCKFEELETIGQVQNVLSACTYWYKRLRSAKNGMSRNARALLRLVAGQTGMNDRKLKDSFLLTLKPTPAGYNRLRNILATTDGLLIQLMLSFPEHPKMWKWSTYDQITHCVISNLIPDYCCPEAEKTAYTELKTIRQRIKEEGFRPSGDLKNISDIRRFSFFIPLLNSVGDIKSPWNMAKVAMLSQTRAAGVPPPAVKRLAIAKWMATVTTPSNSDLAESLKPALQQAVDDFYDEAVKGVPEEQLEIFFRRCMKSSKISLSDSAELNVTVADGGKLEAARRALQVAMNDGVKEIDLETGEHTGKNIIYSDGIGEMLFHQTLNKWKEGPYKDGKMDVRVTAVPELGKYRVITVSSLDHAILLHPLSHMTLEFFGAYAPTAAGVKSSNQAWEFFRRLSGSNPKAGFIFDDKQEKYVMSTDWSEATDHVDHYIARVILGRFFFRFGLPKWYAKMCMFALTGPRMVRDPLDDNGKPWLTKRAVLMGDPGTKTLLTMYHPVAHQLARRAIQSLQQAEKDE